MEARPETLLGNGGGEVLVKHGGQSPNVDPTAWVAPNAVLSGPVTVGPRARILYGAVLTAELGASVELGPECVVMEQAVLRGSGRFSLTLGEQVLVGPHAYLTGCRIGDRAFVATGAMVFNGATVGEASVVALGGKVHIDTEVLPDTRIPMGYIAFGRPARIHPPDDSPLVHEELGLDFMRYVFGVETHGRTRTEVMREAMAKYTRALGSHIEDGYFK
jgi:carbonic anhydrase/acetyltransferase-like protein (isoleucine patch superfamily)